MLRVRLARSTAAPCILWRWIAILGKLFPPLFHPPLSFSLSLSPVARSLHENALSAPKLHHWLHCKSGSGGVGGSFRPPVARCLPLPSPSGWLLSFLLELSLEQLPGLHDADRLPGERRRIAGERAFEIRSLSPPFKPHAKEKEMQMTLALFSPFSGFFLCGFDLTERKK